MAVERDPSPVSRHDDYTLRQFLLARRTGDEDGARRWWEELVCDNLDRIRGMVRLHSHGLLSPTEQDDALQRALVKLLHNMIETFRGTSMGEWVNATKTLVFGVCVDTQRYEQRVSKHHAPLTTHDEEGHDTGRLDREAFKALERRRQEAEDLEASAEFDARASGFLDWAIPQLSPKRRAVIELDRKGVPCEEIQERLGVSRDVVYASRSRALKDLAELRKGYGS